MQFNPDSIQAQLLTVFLDTIQIDEVFPEEVEIINYVKRHLIDLGLHPIQDSFGNIICQVSGKGVPLMLNTHLDIPEPAPEIEYELKDGYLRSTGQSILGADPKSGLAVLLVFLKYLVQQNLITRPLEIVFTLGEEAGLKGSKHLDYSLLQSKEGLVIDEDGPWTNVVTQAPGKCELNVTLQGKTAHARDWSDGINAIEHLAKIISQLQQGELTPGVTFNIGKIFGGTAVNSVPGEAGWSSELRSYDMLKLQDSVNELVASIQKYAHKHNLTVDIAEDYQYQSYELPADSPLLNKISQIYQRLGSLPNFYSTFGASDANMFNANGISAVAIGSEYYLAHQHDEYINLPGMVQLVHFLVEFVRIS
jgi:tripeptide aminopeptidase